MKRNGKTTSERSNTRTIVMLPSGPEKYYLRKQINQEEKKWETTLQRSNTRTQENLLA